MICYELTAMNDPSLTTSSWMKKRIVVKNFHRRMLDWGHSDLFIQKLKNANASWIPTYDSDSSIKHQVLQSITRKWNIPCCIWPGGGHNNNLQITDGESWNSTQLWRTCQGTGPWPSLRKWQFPWSPWCGMQILHPQKKEGTQGTLHEKGVHQLLG